LESSPHSVAVLQNTIFRAMLVLLYGSLMSVTNGH
jgi:hypothetical protein